MEVFWTWVNSRKWMIKLRGERILKSESDCFRQQSTRRRTQHLNITDTPNMSLGPQPGLMRFHNLTTVRSLFELQEVSIICVKLVTFIETSVRRLLVLSRPRNYRRSRMLTNLLFLLSSCTQYWHS
ncbi:hypothetical protein LENED_007320 [Lentinula edodes]|uniref:Uncharacterized protein n=1 Tax=Lentinula edodes TaxID=5353 RepID=A0A1Q3EE22_LENED|nr:hypothetical protein LENED_007320 [Lentinula edodes]